MVDRELCSDTLRMKQLQEGNGLQALAPAEPQIGFLIISLVFFVLPGRAEVNNDQKEFGVKSRTATSVSRKSRPMTPFRFLQRQ